MKVLLLFAAVLSLSFAGVDMSAVQTTEVQTSFNPTSDWQVFGNYEGITVEYKQEKIVHSGRNALFVFFKVTNTNTETKTFNFTRAFYRNDVCWNCKRLDHQENNFSLTLAPNESVEGSATNKENALMLFDRFTKLVPGMTDDELTNVVFSNVTVQ
ncbi:hypothetical protein [Lishizhenia sp.]|uniref:hypothetical protein n=1 Tax=Lishizhenia sp. TaxID=2497594 RepID=UPI00299EDA47|nr:hypothetical protein [Lishizhenia sp.]MDX1445613.1 hypothetical protein [Lishizhenia sp.]